MEVRISPAAFHIYAKMVEVERGKWSVTKREDSIESESGFSENYIYIHTGFVHAVLIFGKQKKICKFEYIFEYILFTSRILLPSPEFMKIYIFLFLWL